MYHRASLSVFIYFCVSCFFFTKSHFLCFFFMFIWVMFYFPYSWGNKRELRRGNKRKGKKSYFHSWVAYVLLENQAGNQRVMATRSTIIVGRITISQKLKTVEVIFSKNWENTHFVFSFFFDFLLICEILKFGVSFIMVFGILYGFLLNLIKYFFFYLLLFFSWLSSLFCSLLLDP